MTFVCVLQQRYLSQPWWDISMDKQQTPRYVYDQENDKWKAYSDPSTTSGRYTWKKTQFNNTCSKNDYDRIFTLQT